jgi:phospholipid-translocating ATPase
MNPQATTLAIGDGGNDVNMIQTAHIGVGLYGREGYQAASGADFAISEFKQLKRLMFVHGRWNSRRIAFYIMFYFFKNILFTLPQFLYAFVSGFSGETIWEDWYLLLFNSAITALGVCMYSVFEQDVNPQTDPRVKLILPKLYEANKRKDLVSIRIFLVWLAYGLFGAVIVSLFPSYIYWGSVLGSDGKTDGLWAMSVCMYTSVIVAVNIVLVINVQYWTWITHLIIWILSYILYCPVFVFIYDQVTSDTAKVYLNAREFLSTFPFWAAVMLSAGVCTIPYYFFITWRRLFISQTIDVIIQNRKAEVLDRRQTDSEAKMNDKAEMKHLTGSTMHSTNKGSHMHPEVLEEASVG